jgi:hypothetical protein
MTTRRSRLLLLTAIAALAPVIALAQEPVQSFDQLNTRLKVGDTVWVTDAQGREIKGRIRDLSPASLRLDAGGATQEFQAGRVGTIRVQPKDPLRNGVLWGAGVGFALGALSCGANPQCAGDESGAGVTVALSVIGAAAGAGIGAAIDAARKPPKLVVYRAPGASGRAHLSLAPMLAPRTKGVAVSFAF